MRPCVVRVTGSSTLGGGQVSKSLLEDLLLLQMRSAGLPVPEREYAFAKSIGRKFRFDFAWVDRKIAVEVQGGTWVNGRHNRPAGQRSDNEKFRIAQKAGWRVFPFLGDEVRSGYALNEIEELLS
jgi:hypothetical protein